MTNYLKVDHYNRKLVMDRAFSKYSAIAGSEEYILLQNCRKDYPNYTVITRRIKTNENKKTYKGLNYDYMEFYIRTHEPFDTRDQVLEELKEMQIIASCHSRGYRYPVIKKWFLKKYPEIAAFGLPEYEELVAQRFIQKQELAAS